MRATPTTMSQSDHAMYVDRVIVSASAHPEYSRQSDFSFFFASCA